MLEGLAASNIAWPRHALDQALRLLPELGLSGVEIAPRNIFDSWDVGEQEVRALRRRLNDAGLVCPSLQGILFDAPGATVFGSAEGRELLARHFVKVARIAGAFKARACVFGAPRQRDKGALSDKQASEIAVDFFRSVAPVFEQEGTALAFEANAKHYGCNFVTTTREAIALVRAIDREGVRLQIDTGTILLEEEDFDVLLDAAEYAVHAHASEPDLQVIKMGGADHQGLAASLSRSAYHGFLSIEMRCSEDWEASLRGAAKLVREQYA